MGLLVRPLRRGGFLPRSRMARQEAVLFYAIVGFWFIGFILLTGGPMLASLLLGFTQFDGVHAPTFVGMTNYTELIRDSLFWQSLKVTAIYTFVGVPLGICFSLSIALLLNQKLPGLAIWRTIYYLPAVLSGVAVALLWRWIYQPDFGIINATLWSLFGIKGPQWLYDTRWVLPSLILMSIWSAGSSMLLYLAALQAIPTHLYEAAELDGAGSARKFFHVTIPMITPVIFFNLILGIIGSFQVFTAAFIMTNKGGPNYASYFFVLYIYQHAFEFFKMGKASALAWILFLIISFFTVLAFKTSALWVYYEAERKV
jgi:multiple sugar transport system permease protein